MRVYLKTLNMLRFAIKDIVITQETKGNLAVIQGIFRCDSWVN